MNLIRMKACKLVTIFFLWVGFFVNVPAAAFSDSYIFTINGEVIRPKTVSLDGSNDLKPGDLLELNDLYIVLDEPKTYAFENNLEKDGCLYLLNSDGTKTVIGVRIATVYDRVPVSDPNTNKFQMQSSIPGQLDHNLPGMGQFRNFEEKIRFVNPLAAMTPDQIQKVRGIKVEEWKENLRKQIKYINANRTCITINDGKILPDLPGKLRYLSYVHVEKEDAGKLSSFSDLEFLALYGMTDDMYASAFSNKSKLKVLYLPQYESTINLAYLEHLSNLRVLVMPYTETPKNFSSIQKLRQLRLLDISDSNVSDLSCLGKINTLREINATSTPVTQLPKGKLPNLEKLWIMSNKLSLEQVEDFENSHPKCLVIYRWNRSLPKLLAEATRVDVGDYLFPFQSYTNLTDSNAASVMKLIDNLAVDPCEREAGTLCGADFCLAFYNGNKPLAMFEIVCSGNIRWQNGSPQEVMLTKSSGDYLAKWLADHGFPFMLEERKKQAEEYKIASEKKHKEFKAFIALLPDQLAKTILTKYNAKIADFKLKRESMNLEFADPYEGQELTDLIVNTIKDQLPDDQNRAELCFRILASDSNSFSYYPYVLGGILRDIPKQQKQSAVFKLLSDPNAIRGVSQWLINMYGWEQVDNSFLESVLPKVALIALDNPDRMKTISSLGQIKGEASKHILRKILNGEIVLPPAKPLLPNGQRIQYLPQYSCAALAASALAQQGDVSSLPLITELSKTATKDDKRMFQMAADTLSLSMRQKQK